MLNEAVFLVIRESPLDMPADALLALLVGILFIGAGNVVLWAMVEKSNQRLPGNEQISFGPLHRPLIKLWRTYRHLYPEGRLHVWLVVCVFLAAIFLVLSFNLDEASR